MSTIQGFGISRKQNISRKESRPGPTESLMQFAEIMSKGLKKPSQAKTSQILNSAGIQVGNKVSFSKDPRLLSDPISSLQQVINNLQTELEEKDRAVNYEGNTAVSLRFLNNVATPVVIDGSKEVGKSIYGLWEKDQKARIDFGHVVLNYLQSITTQTPETDKARINLVAGMFLTAMGMGNSEITLPADLPNGFPAATTINTGFHYGLFFLNKYLSKDSSTPPVNFTNALIESSNYQSFVENQLVRIKDLPENQQKISLPFYGSETYVFHSGGRQQVEMFRENATNFFKAGEEIYRTWKFNPANPNLSAVMNGYQTAVTRTKNNLPTPINVNGENFLVWDTLHLLKFMRSFCRNEIDQIPNIKTPVDIIFSGLKTVNDLLSSRNRPTTITLPGEFEVGIDGQVIGPKQVDLSSPQAYQQIETWKQKQFNLIEAGLIIFDQLRNPDPAVIPTYYREALNNLASQYTNLINIMQTRPVMCVLVCTLDGGSYVIHTSDGIKSFEDHLIPLFHHRPPPGWTSTPGINTVMSRRR